MKKLLSLFIMLLILIVVLQVEAAQIKTSSVDTAILFIPNMDCGVCPITVKKALSAVSGVNSVDVDTKNKTAIVKFDSQKATTSQLINATTQAGYPSSLQ